MLVACLHVLFNYFCAADRLQRQSSSAGVSVHVSAQLRVMSSASPAKAQFSHLHGDWVRARLGTRSCQRTYVVLLSVTWIKLSVRSSPADGRNMCPQALTPTCMWTWILVRSHLRTTSCQRTYVVLLSVTCTALSDLI